MLFAKFQKNFGILIGRNSILAVVNPLRVFRKTFRPFLGFVLPVNVEVSIEGGLEIEGFR